MRSPSTSVKYTLPAASTADPSVQATQVPTDRPSEIARARTASIVSLVGRHYLRRLRRPTSLLVRVRSIYLATGPELLDVRVGLG
jgi:hypothetical protein